MKGRYQQKGAVILIPFLIIVFIGIGFLIVSSNLSRKNGSLTQPGSDNLLQAACEEAIDDYPDWTKVDTDLVMWETPDKSFNYRNSPEEPSVGIGGPVKPPGILADMDFVGQDEISYVSKQGNLWQIGLFKLNGMSAPDNSIIYEQAQQFSSINISPISKGEYIVFLSDNNKGFLKHLDTTTSKESTLATISPVNTNGLKLAVSPKETYVYLLHDKIMTVFNINSKKQTSEIDSVENVVWLGDSYLLYANQEVAYVYDVKTKKESQLDITGSVQDLSFNPKGGGVIAYTQGSDTWALSCATGQILASKENTKFRAFASGETAIVEGKDFFGFWKFKDADWTVTFIEKSSDIATVWGRY